MAVALISGLRNIVIYQSHYEAVGPHIDPRKNGEDELVSEGMIAENSFRKRPKIVEVFIALKGPAECLLNVCPVSERSAIFPLFCRSLFISECGFKTMQLTSTIR